MLEARQLTVRYGGRVAVERVGFHLRAGEWLMLVGPNGAGKSTLLSALAACAPYDGTVLLDGKNSREYKPREYARRVGVLSQMHKVEYAYTVEDVVRMGRYAHGGGFFSRPDADGESCVEAALKDTGLLELRGQSVLTLSGGELQRVFLAQVFAQRPEILLLDEPANHLDIVYQRQMFTQLQRWLGKGNRALISVVHDLSLAMKFGTHAMLLEKGKQAALGPPREALTRERLGAAYGMDVHGWITGLLSCWE